MISSSGFVRTKWLTAACSAAALLLCGAAAETAAAASRAAAAGPAAAAAPAAAGASTDAAPAAPSRKSASSIARRDLTGTWKSYRAGGIKFNPRLTTPVSQGADPPLKPKYLAAWKARQKAAHEADLRGQPIFGGYENCVPDGMPSMMMAMFPMDVLQTPGQITIIQEAYRQVRYIYLNQKQVPIEDAEPEFWGHSVGHWVGDTLVVNTVGIKPEVRFRDVPHSNLMQIDERIRLLGPNRFEDRVTITDPVYLVKPWTFTWKYQRLPGYKMLEYVCESRRVVDKNGAQHMLLFGSPSAGQTSAKSQKAGTH